ncbi:MAG: hypothetical protein JSV97_00835 [candidate division WOR-3 bacterium]|nr:MAG: hypothetical protein JSV97_00835 [candidate division WOR-3 bacterium]
MIFEQLNELKYAAETGKTYIIYFLKFWRAEDKKDDFLIKYQINTTDKEFFCYGRITKKRAISDLQLTQQDMKKLPDRELQQKVQNHLKRLIVHVIKRGLDKGFEESNAEFIFDLKPPVARREWHE